ncbi:MAG: alpha/beta hydrolase [Verrucomicrobiota bacterium]
MKTWMIVAAGLGLTHLAAAEAPLNVWPGEPPGETKELGPEHDRFKEGDRLIAGRRIIKLTNVSTPTIQLFRPAAEKDTGAAVIICPGGGHHILALDLEGTEVAEWLASIGVTGIVLKYRVPAREKERRWRAAVQDAQRAVSLVRSKAADWKLDPKRIGILGFSAGGQTAGLTTVFQDERTYEPIDDADLVSCRPDFAILVYPAWFVTKQDPTKLVDEIKVDADTPPMFFAHAWDDRITPLNSVLLFAELKKHNVPAELHVFSKGGHGYGLRETEMPVTGWPKLCADWLKTEGWTQDRR